MGAPCPRSSTSSSIPAIEIMSTQPYRVYGTFDILKRRSEKVSLRLPAIGTERGARLLRERHVDHIACLDPPAHPSLLEKEIEVLLDTAGVHRAIDVHGLGIHLAHQPGIHVEALCHGRDDLVGADAGDLSALDRIVVEARAPQPGAHESSRDILALERELFAVEDH